MGKNFFLIGEAAAQVHMTRETLRHYDRIGLVKPSRVDQRTKYRYYNEEDLVRLNTVHALQQMDLPLQEIHKVLEYNDLEKIVAFLDQAEQKADEKIASLRYAQSKIRLAKASYEKKLHGWTATQGLFTKRVQKRILMLADPVNEITANDLWSYQRHFYQRLSDRQKAHFTFEDQAGVYRTDASARYFAVCTEYEEIEDLITIPAGIYLCTDCTEKTLQTSLQSLLDIVKEEYDVTPDFVLQLVMVSGILQWKYQLQVYVGPSEQV